MILSSSLQFFQVLLGRFERSPVSVKGSIGGRKTLWKRVKLLGSLRLNEIRSQDFTSKRQLAHIHNVWLWMIMLTVTVPVMGTVWWVDFPCCLTGRFAKLQEVIYSSLHKLFIFSSHQHPVINTAQHTSFNFDNFNLFVLHIILAELQRPSDFSLWKPKQT